MDSEDFFRGLLPSAKIDVFKDASEALVARPSHISCGQDLQWTALLYFQGEGDPGEDPGFERIPATGVPPTPGLPPKFMSQMVGFRNLCVAPLLHHA